MTSGDATSLQTGSKLVSGSALTLRRIALISRPVELTSSVLPSGAARATASAAIAPPAPGRLSTTTVCPLVRTISSARMRTSASMAPPVGTVTTTRIVRDACAHTACTHDVLFDATSASPSVATIAAALKILDAQRIDDVPELFAVLVEDQLAVGRRRRPRTARDLALELARTPAGVAKHDQALLRALAGTDVAQDVEIHGDRHVAVDAKRLRAHIVGAVNDEAELGLHRAACEQTDRAVHRRSLLSERLQQLRQRPLGGRPVDDQHEGAVLVVARNQDHAALEARIAHRGRRH